ncbi:hypothetical protein F7725_014990 [Dissostichus mawsoni]|uniref:Uncharacterized protein n=1 Tax=Dissostichus mawsoni TaxID=36200 RepID=A0A7J5YH65_DISMA|nr:hypothetical protein F7725_014990 [Dissostichus mawsoni]
MIFSFFAAFERAAARRGAVAGRRVRGHAPSSSNQSAQHAVPGGRSRLRFNVEVRADPRPEPRTQRERRGRC